MRDGRKVYFVAFAMAALAGSGCGTTRMTDTQRAASEMMLVSQAIDNSIAQLDFSALRGRSVFLDTQYLDGTVDKGYLISSLRQHLLAHGALLKEDRQQAYYVVEPRAGAVGTDKHSLLFGTPAMSLPALMPGIPTTIPEVALVKKTDQKGVAKVAVFAYNRVSGRALWQSGTKEADSTLKDLWVFGAGPISSGSIRKRMELAGEQLPTLQLPFQSGKQSEPPLAAHELAPPLSESHVWTNSESPPPLQPVPFALVGLTGAAAVVERRIIRSGPPSEETVVQAVPKQALPRPPVAPSLPLAPVAPVIPVAAPPVTIQAPPGPLPRPN